MFLRAGHAPPLRVRNHPRPSRNRADRQCACGPDSPRGCPAIPPPTNEGPLSSVAGQGRRGLANRTAAACASRGRSYRYPPSILPVSSRFRLSFLPASSRFVFRCLPGILPLSFRILPGILPLSCKILPGSCPVCLPVYPRCLARFFPVSSQILSAVTFSCGRRPAAAPARRRSGRPRRSGPSSASYAAGWEW